MGFTAGVIAAELGALRAAQAFTFHNIDTLL